MVFIRQVTKSIPQFVAHLRIAVAQAGTLFDADKEGQIISNCNKKVLIPQSTLPIKLHLQLIQYAGKSRSTHR